MALHWNMTKVHDCEKLHESDMEWAITESVIWSTIVVDLGSITEDNLDEWEWRLAVWQNLHGAFMRSGGEEYYIVRKHIERRVGLSVNVVDIKRSNFIKKLFKNGVDSLILNQNRNNDKLEEK